MASLENLAASVSGKASEISILLNAIGKAPPSLGEHGQNDFEGESGTSVDRALRSARDELLSSAKDIIRLVSGPRDSILSMAWSFTDTANLDVIVRLGIPQLVPLGGTISIKDLAASTSVPVDILGRILRYSIANGIFLEPSVDMIAHTSTSAVLASDAHIRAISRFSTQYLSNVQLKLADAIIAQRDYEVASETNGNGKLPPPPAAAFNLAYNTEETVFERFGRDPEAAEAYHKYLVGRVNTSLWSVHHLQAAYNWAGLGNAKIIDVGGSSGHTVLALAPLCPTATFVIQDISPDAIEMGRKIVSDFPKIAPRVEFMPHDFFTPQSMSADVYIFRHILHDWSDEDCVRIISALLPALKSGAKVMVSEGIVPEPPAATLNNPASKMIRIEDMFMLAGHGACERSVSDFVSVFKKASEKFHYVGETSGSETGAFQSLLEFVYTE